MFTYEPYRSPFSQDIASVMLRRGDLAAHAAEQIGAIQAARAQQVGQAYGNAIAGAGNAVTGAIQQATDPQRKLATMQVDDATRQRQFMATANGIVANLMQKKADGSSTIDRQQVASAFAQQNIPLPMQQAIFKQLDDLDASVQKFQQVRIDHAADVAHATIGMIDAGLNPQTAFAGAMAYAKANNMASDQELAPLVQAVTSTDDPKIVRQMLIGLRGLSEKYKDLSKPTFAPRQSPGYIENGQFTPLPQTSETKPEANVVFKDAAGVEHPVTFNGKDYLYNGNVVTDQVTRPTSKEPNSQHVPFMLDGKSVMGAFVPDDKGGRYIFNGQDVTARARPIPPAQIQVGTATNDALSKLPAWTMDSSRPSGADANRVEPTLGLSPNGLYQATLNYIATGQYPQTGRGSDPRSQAVRAAVNAKVGAIAADSGMDEPALRAFYKSNASSLTQQQKAYDSIQAFMATADRNADRLAEVLKQIPDTGSPLLNKPVRALEQKALGNVDMATFRTYLQSVQNEYARIIAQPNLAGQLTDAARHEAEILIDPNATVQQQLAAIDALKTEGTNRLVSLADQIQRIQQRMRGADAGDAPKPSSDSTPVTTPNLAGLAPGRARTFTEGPFSGQTWTLGADGRPVRVR